MSYEDKQRAADFYSKTFGWKPQFLGEDMGGYVVVQTDETDTNGMLKQSNRINGGLYKRLEDPALNTPSLVIAVPNIEEASKNISEGGGKVIGEPVEIPGIGKYLSFYDTEGNRVSILQPHNAM